MHRQRCCQAADANWEWERQVRVENDGLCCCLQHEKFQSAPGSRVGTPAYLAPEVIMTTKGQTYDGKVRPSQCMHRPPCLLVCRCQAVASIKCYPSIESHSWYEWM